MRLDTASSHTMTYKHKHAAEVWPGAGLERTHCLWLFNFDAVAGLSLHLTHFRKAVRDVTDPHLRVQLFY
jgi:hypothetical protein